MFLINGNICGDRVRIGRAMHQTPLTQEQLAEIIRNMGMANMTKMIIYSIEKKNGMFVTRNCMCLQKH